jgi:exodeoxyribonuclease VII large subunit
MSGTGQTKIHSVTELTSEIRFRLYNEFSSVWVSGEVSGVTRPGSGHQYFTLKDKNAQISAIIWRSTAQRMNFRIENGQQLICFGDVDVYPQRGTYQLIVRQAQPLGEGALQLAFRQLHQKLESEGLFKPDHKQPLPTFPQHVVLITSPTGAAIKDFLQVLNRRWPDIRVTIIPVKVQGPGSAEQIVTAIESIRHFSEQPDIVVLTRGGGSIEDLWSFNEEAVCRAIYACSVPLVCGVGHEIDVTLADLTADVRALTPSEAAERIVPDRMEVKQELHSLERRLSSLLLAKHKSARQHVLALQQRPAITQPFRNLNLVTQELDRLESQLERGIRQKFAESETLIQHFASQLEAYNPLAILARGYSMTTNPQGQLIIRADDIDVGETVVTRLRDGQLTSVVSSKTMN